MCSFCSFHCVLIVLVLFSHLRVGWYSHIHHLHGLLDPAQLCVDDNELVGATNAGGSNVDGPDIGKGISDASQEATDFQERQAKVYTKALKFLRDRPLSRCLVGRQCLEPWRTLMNCKNHLGSAKFEQEQEFLEIQRKAANSGDLNEGDRRDYRLTVCAHNTLEKKALKLVELLMCEPCLWECFIPEQDQHLSLRALAFRLLSRTRCLIEASLSWRHRQMPFRLFLLVHRPELASELQNTRACLLDAWSQQHIEIGLKRGGLDCPQADQSRLLACKLGFTDSGLVESLWSASRREAVVRNTQTGGIALEELSASFVCDRLRIAGCSNATSTQTLPVADYSEVIGAANPDTGQPAVSRQTGPWRGYVRQRYLGSKFDSSKFSGAQSITMTQVASDYKALGPVEKARLVEIGEAAASAPSNSHWRSPFGPDTREVARAASKRAFDAQLQHLRNSKQADDAGAIDDHALVVAGDSALGVVNRALRISCGSLSYAERLKVASRQWMLERQLKLELARENLAIRVKWQREDASKELEELLVACPSLEPLREQLKIVPCSDGNVTVRVSLNPKTVGEFGAWLSSNSHKTNLGKAVLLDWAVKHQPIMHEAS